MNGYGYSKTRVSGFWFWEALWINGIGLTSCVQSSHFLGMISSPMFNVLVLYISTCSIPNLLARNDGMPVKVERLMKKQASPTL